MNLIDAVKRMDVYIDPSKEKIKEFLKCGYHIIVSDKNNYGDNLLKYDHFIEDGILFACKMSDSTRDEIILTPEMAVYYTDDYFDELWNSYLSGRDVFYIDTQGFMFESTIREAQFSIDSIKRQLNKKEVIFFNDIYSPSIVVEKTLIKILDCKNNIFVRKEHLQDAIEGVTGAESTDDIDAADVVVLIMPNDCKADTKSFYEILDDKLLSNPKVTKELNKHPEMNKRFYKKTILFWTGNVFMASLVSPEDALLRATLELGGVIDKINEK